jgi:trans-aconitate 2-methyltransferase
VTSRASYAFGDSALARERLEIVAGTFGGPTRSLLEALPEHEARYVLDLGCGPGFTTTLLLQRFPRAWVTGLDASAAMIAEASERVPTAHFAVDDVTMPLRLPADVVYARLLLGHLADPAAALANWTRALRPPGLLVCEEPVRYVSDDPVFARYEDAVTSVVAARGGTLWAADALDHELPSCTRALDRVIEHPVRTGRAAAMFWRNAATWGSEIGGADEMITYLRDLEAADPDDHVMWELRQVVWLKSTG